MSRASVVSEWCSVPKRIRGSIRGLKGKGLSIRGGSQGWSVAEYVHHLVEANFIASHVVLAALGKPGCTYDWSWVTPDRAWMKRLSYGRAPVGPALDLLEALTRHVSSLLTLGRGSLRRHVAILDAPRASPRRVTVGGILRDEVGHATHHIGDIESARRSGKTGR